MRIILSILLVLLFSAAGQVSAQESKGPLISGNFDEWDFDAFACVVEASTSYHFFYNPAQTDSLCIHLYSEGQTLEQLLDKIFTGTPFHYIIDADGQVFISKGLLIRTGLAEGFFGKRAAESRDTVTYGDLTNTSLKQVTSENKLYEIGRKTNTITPGPAVISGYIRNARTGEPIGGAAIYSVNPAGRPAPAQKGHISLHF